MRKCITSACLLAYLPLHCSSRGGGSNAENNWERAGKAVPILGLAGLVAERERERERERA